MIEEKETGISIMDMLKLIWKRKIIVIIASIIFMVVGTLAIKFGYNPSKEIYTTTFEYSFPGIDDSKFLNVSSFDYREIISEINLNNTKNSNSEFANINVEKMLDVNDISIERVYNEKQELLSNTFKINVKQKYFKSTKTAKKFLTAIIEETNHKSNNIVKNYKYDYYLNLANSSVNYESQIANINYQINIIKNGYTSLINKYGDLFLEEDGDGMLVSDYQKAFNEYIFLNDTALLSFELTQNGYVKDYSVTKAELILKKQSLLKKIEDNNAAIENLHAEIDTLNSMQSGTTYQSFDTIYNKILDLIVSNTNSNTEIIEIDKKLASEFVASLEKEEFALKISKMLTKLEEFTKIYTDVTKNVYLSQSKVTFAKSSVIIGEGGYSTTLVIPITLVAGVILSSVVVLIFELANYKKEENNNLETEKKTE